MCKRPLYHRRRRGRRWDSSNSSGSDGNGGGVRRSARERVSSSAMMSVEARLWCEIERTDEDLSQRIPCLRTGSNSPRSAPLHLLGGLDLVSRGLDEPTFPR